MFAVQKILKTEVGLDAQEISSYPHGMGMPFTKIEKKRILLVMDVRPNSLASRAGFKKNDIFLSEDGEHDLLTRLPKAKSIYHAEVLRGAERVQLSMDISHVNFPK